MKTFEFRIVNPAMLTEEQREKLSNSVDFLLTLEDIGFEWFQVFNVEAKDKKDACRIGCGEAFVDWGWDLKNSVYGAFEVTGNFFWVFERRIAEICPNVSFGEDKDGQVIFYTGMRINEKGKMVSLRKKKEDKVG